MENIEKILLGTEGFDSYQRIGVSHPIAWYAGRDTTGRSSIFCIVETKPTIITSTRLIDVFVGVRKDLKFGITFSLKDESYIGLFSHFGEDMVDYTKNTTKPEKAADVICARYIQWQNAFKRNNGGILSYEEMKGLVGELLFMKMRLFSTYGKEHSIDSWSGVELTDQDFNCGNTWYEVKSTVSGSTTVKISSIEQLDTGNEGHLVVMLLDKTSEDDSSRITLNNMYEMVLSDLDSLSYQEKFKNKMLSFGYYPNEIYNKYGFKYNGLFMYKVNNDFPCLRRKDVPVAVQTVKYELSLPAINEFKEE